MVSTPNNQQQLNPYGEAGKNPMAGGLTAGVAGSGGKSLDAELGGVVTAKNAADKAAADKAAADAAAASTSTASAGQTGYRDSILNWEKSASNWTGGQTHFSNPYMIPILQARAREKAGAVPMPGAGASSGDWALYNTYVSKYAPQASGGTSRGYSGSGGGGSMSSGGGGNRGGYSSSRS